MVVRCAWLLEQGAMRAREEWSRDRKFCISLRLVERTSGEAGAPKEKAHFLSVDPSVLLGDPTAARLHLSQVLSARRLPTPHNLISDIVSFSRRMTTLPCSMCGGTTEAAAAAPAICDCCGWIPIIRVCIAVVSLVNSQREEEEQESVNVRCAGNYKYNVAYLDEWGSNQLITLERVRMEEDGRSSSTELCSICLEQFGEGAEEVTKFPCSHLFHSFCIHQWLERSLLCPLCRFRLPYRLCGRADLQTY